jgi:hypothetical protein
MKQANGKFRDETGKSRCHFQLTSEEKYLQVVLVPVDRYVDDAGSF